jgi:hypothetical protein
MTTPTITSNSAIGTTFFIFLCSRGDDPIGEKLLSCFFLDNNCLKNRRIFGRLKYISRGTYDDGDTDIAVVVDRDDRFINVKIKKALTIGGSIVNAILQKRQRIVKGNCVFFIVQLRLI